jgi:hypothetical protein
MRKIYTVELDEELAPEEIECDSMQITPDFVVFVSGGDMVAFNIAIVRKIRYTDAI